MKLEKTTLKWQFHMLTDSKYRPFSSANKWFTNLRLFFLLSISCRDLRQQGSYDMSCNSLFCQVIPFRFPTEVYITLKGTSNEYLAGENEHSAHPVRLNYMTVSLWRQRSRDRQSVHCRTVYGRPLMSCFSVLLHSCCLQWCRLVLLGQITQ